MSSRRQLSIVAKGARTNFLCASPTLVECMRRRPPRARRIANNAQKYTSWKERLSRFSDAHWTWVIIGRACGDAKLGNRAARGEVTRELNNNVEFHISHAHAKRHRRRSESSFANVRKSMSGTILFEYITTLSYDAVVMVMDIWFVRQWHHEHRAFLILVMSSRTSKNICLGYRITYVLDINLISRFQ